MARPFQSEAMRGNMAESLARRPAIANVNVPATAPGEFEGRKKLVGACTIAVGRLIPDPEQPRKTFPEESIGQLAQSFRARGQLVPALVRWSAEADRYVIIDGERRYRAAILAGLTDLACVVEQDATPEDLLEIQLVTNALREDVAPVEQARSWRRLMDARGLTHRQLAERLNYDHATITRSLGLLNLPEEIQSSVDAGEIRPHTAYELSRIQDPTEQAELAEQARAGRLKRDDLRERTKAATKSKPKRAGGATTKAKLPTERTLKTSAGLKVTVSGRKGFDPLAMLEALREATRRVEGELAMNSSEAA